MNKDDIKVIHEKRLQNGLKISTNTKRSDSKLKNLCLRWGFALQLNPLNWIIVQNHKVRRKLFERYLIRIVFSNHRSNCTPKRPSEDNYSRCVDVSPLRKMIQRSLPERKVHSKHIAPQHKYMF